jgi:predicted small lipoprotein YifL
MNMRNLLVVMSVSALAACGGGGSGAAAPAGVNSQPDSAQVAPVVSAPPSMAAADLALAGRLYKGDERTPAGFDVEARPANVIGTLSTRHLKNTDFATGPQGISATYEVCTNDMAQAIDWSERQATWQGQYSDLVEMRSDTHMFEVVRVPRADVTAMIRHRVFRCDYLDRSNTDLRVDVGAAGNMNQRPLTADELEKLSEYLWQFTMFNNSDYVVESSTRSSNGGTLVQTIRMGQLVRGAAGACDTVQLSDWTHTMNAVDGTLTRSLSNVRSYQVKSTSSGATSCAG